MMPPKRAAAAKKQSGKSRKDDSDVNTATLKVTLVTDLGPNDVLMGRGAMATDYEGNSRLRDIVHLRHEEYTNANKRNRKHRIAEEIVSAVLARGGRFLQSAETLAEVDASALPKHVAAWYIVRDQAVLVAKVKQLLRDVKPARKNQGTLPRPPPTKPSAPVIFQSPNSTTNTTTTTTNTTTTSTTTASSNQGMNAPHAPYLWHHQQPSQAHTGWPAVNAGASAVNKKSPMMAPMASSSMAQVPNGHQSPTQAQQHHINVSKSTSMLGQANASSILQSLTSGNATRDQQYDALLALSLASRMASQTSSAPVAARQATGPDQQKQHNPVPRPLPHMPPPVAPPAPPAAPPAASSGLANNPALTVLAAALLSQQQQREREHALVDALLTHLLPQLSGEAKPGAPSCAPPPARKPPSPSTVPDPSMTWLFNQLQSREDKRGPAHVGAQTFENITCFLRGEQADPRSAGLLGETNTRLSTDDQQEPSRLATLERLLLSRDRWTQQPQQQPSATQSSNSEDSLAKVLRALQGQYFPSNS